MHNFKINMKYPWCCAPGRDFILRHILTNGQANEAPSCVKLTLIKLLIKYYLFKRVYVWEPRVCAGIFIFFKFTVQLGPSGKNLLSGEREKWIDGRMAAAGGWGNAGAVQPAKTHAGASLLIHTHWRVHFLWSRAHIHNCCRVARAHFCEIVVSLSVDVFN